MARKTRKSIVLEKRTPPFQLEDINLLPGQRVRFKENDLDGARWYTAKVRGINMDGSVAMIELTSGNWRSKMPERLQIEVKGPRGGKTWTNLISN